MEGIERDGGMDGPRSSIQDVSSGFRAGIDRGQQDVAFGVALHQQDYQSHCFESCWGRYFRTAVESSQDMVLSGGEARHSLTET
jgi:hypothetical protein